MRLFRSGKSQHAQKLYLSDQVSRRHSGYIQRDMLGMWTGVPTDAMGRTLLKLSKLTLLNSNKITRQIYPKLNL